MRIFDSKKIKLFFFLLLFAYSSQATTYYVSSSGSNYNAGTSADKAWASILGVNARNFSAGDQILFEGGHTFSGFIYFDANDRGTAAQPITIGSYGNGKATISSGASYGMYVYNTAGFKINNLIFKGSGRTTNTMAGIFFFMDKANTRLSMVNIDDVEVYGYKGSGIMFGSNNNTSGFDNVSITNSSIHDNGVAGISSYAQAVLGHRDFYLGNNKVYNNAGVPEEQSTHTGSGIMLGGVDGGVIEYCEAYNNGWLNGHPEGGPVGIWVYSCNDIIIQNNESHHNKTGTTRDGGGFDLDGGTTNSIMQYNYSHDNDGAGYLLAQYGGAATMKNLTIRYNISENDARKNSNGSILLWATNSNGGIQNADIYNNTIYLSPASNGTPTAFFVSTGNLTNVKVRNNIIQTTGGLQAVRSLTNSGIRFEGNAYWASGSDLKIYWNGTIYATLEKWRDASQQELLNGKAVGVATDPGLTGPGKGVTIGDPTKLANLAGYKLKSGSDMIGAGLNLKAAFGLSIGNVDFWKNNISNKQSYNIGADQSGEAAADKQQNQTITFADIADQVYGAEPFSLQATASSGLSVSFAIASGPATLSGNKITLTGVGTVTVTATQAGNANYKAASAVSQSFKVSQKSLLSTTISFSIPETKNVGDAPFVLTATSNNSASSILFTSSNPKVISVAKVGNNWLATVGVAGTTQITASQAGDDEYAAGNVVKTLTVAEVASSPVSIITPNTGTGTTRYEAEGYTDMEGVNTELTSDTGGGLNVGRLEAGNWVKYKVNVSAAGTYAFNFRLAGSTGGEFEIRNSAGKVLETVEVPVTGDWQSWTTISASVALNSGSQTIQVYAIKNGWNFNWFEINNTSGSVTSNFASARYEAEDYTDMEGVNTELTSDTGGGLNVGRLEAGNWVKYKVNVSAAGTYAFNFRLAGSTGGEFEIRNSAGKVLETVEVPVTGDWQSWTTISASVALNSGSQTIQVYAIKNGWNFNWFEISNATTSQQSARSQFTEDLSLQNSLDNATISWSVYPNPTPDKVEISLNEQIKGDVTINLLDSNGKVLEHITVEEKNNYSTPSLSLAHLKNGIYIIQLRGQGIKAEKKIVKR